MNRKIMILFVCFLVSGVSIIPIISGDNLNLNTAGIESDEMRQEIKVTVSKLNIDGFIKRDIQRISIDYYNNFSEKIKNCTTTEEGFKIFKEYNIVPSSMSFSNFQDIMSKKFIKHYFIKRIISFLNFNYNLFTSPFTSFDQDDCWIGYNNLGIISWNGPNNNLYIPLIYLQVNDAGGGSWALTLGTPQQTDGSYSDMIGNLDYNMHTTLVIWIGFLSLNPFFDSNGGSFVGYAAGAQMWDY